MAIEYREVKCFDCGHIFIWNKGEFELPIIYEYRLKITKEMLWKAKCPCCGQEMVVREHVLEGISIGDDSVEAIGVRGI